jgi:hypothetical protein
MIARREIFFDFFRVHTHKVLDNISAHEYILRRCARRKMTSRRCWFERRGRFVVMSRASSQEDALRVADERRRALTAEIPTALGQKAVERKRSGFLNGTLEDSWKLKTCKRPQPARRESLSACAAFVRTIYAGTICRRGGWPISRARRQPRGASGNSRA